VNLWSETDFGSRYESSGWQLGQGIDESGANLLQTVQVVLDLSREPFYFRCSRKIGKGRGQCLAAFQAAQESLIAKLFPAQAQQFSGLPNPFFVRNF
jgi:hypothetical protein